ncbi:RICIN domain-containing protein, partial [Bifidobacterium parmae]
MRRNLLRMVVGGVAAFSMVMPVVPAMADPGAASVAGAVRAAVATTGTSGTTGTVTTAVDTSADGPSHVAKTHAPKTEEQSFTPESAATSDQDQPQGPRRSRRQAQPGEAVVAQADLSGLATVGVDWQQQDMDDVDNAPTYELRYLTGGTWSDWVELPSVDEDTDTMGVSPSYYVGEATKAEARLTPKSGQTITEATLVTIDSGYSAAGDAQGSAYKSAVRTAAAVTASGTIHTREEWWVNGNPAMTWPPERTGHWKGAIVHHTVDRNNYSQAEVPAMVNGIYLYHNVHNDWGDIGYQLLVDRYGGIWEGRDEGVPNQVVPASQVAGAQSVGFNYDTFGVSMIGSYHLNVAPTDAQINSVAAAIAWEFNALGITDPYGTFQYKGTQPRITGHGDQSHWVGGSLNRTACPGQQVWNRMGEIRDKVYDDLNDVTRLPLLSVGSGTFYIDAVRNLKSSLIVENGSADSGASVRLQSGERDAMRFAFNRQSDGSYEIMNVNSGLALDVQGGNATSGAVVQQWTRNGSTAQRWWLRVADSGGVYIQSALGNWVLDLTGGGTADGTKVQLYAPNWTSSQQFIVASATATVPDDSVRLAPAGHDATTFGVADGSYDDGAKLQLQDWSGADSQLFRFDRAGNGLFTIRSVNSAKVLDAVGGGTANGTRVQQWPSNGSMAQLWALRDAGNGAIGIASAKSGRVLDMLNEHVEAGTVVQLYDWKGIGAQSWSVSVVTSSRGGLSRLAGVTRYETADAVVAAGFERSDWVVVASGEAFPDALSASALAGALDAPVLLSGPDGGDVLASRIRSLGAKRAVLIGSEAALSSALEDRVRGLVSEHRVVRFGGSTRYGTSLGVLRDAPGELGSAVVWSDTVIVASGEGPYDALSASPLAYRLKAPVVLAGRDGLDEAMVRAVRDAGFRKVLLVGGESVVPVRVESQLGSLSVTRLAGATRYGTSAEVVAYALEHRILEADGVVLASGENYPDALAGGALAGRTGNVLALVDGPDA